MFMPLSEMDISREERRLELQATLDSLKTETERNKLGQFATPTLLAREIVAYGISNLPPDTPIRFLDPALGTGSFYSALLEKAPLNRIFACRGFEVDGHYGEPAKHLWSNTPIDIQISDFTAVSPPKGEDTRFNLVICNPPYVRHHHIPNSEKIRLSNRAEESARVRLSGLSGLYCYFLAITHTWMATGGIAGWLIPSEFMDVNYGKAVKQYLLDRVTLIRVHRFDPYDVQFEDAIVSSAVVWFINSPPPSQHEIEFTFGGTFDNPLLIKKISSTTLRIEPKWSRFPQKEIRANFKDLTLGDLFTIKRGIATGANKFFVLTEHQIKDHNLPMKFFRPILPGPRYLQEDEIHSDPLGNPILDHRLFILDCKLPEEVIQKYYPTLWQYLATGVPEISDRYLCKHRNPWYIQESRPPAPFICTYIGRVNTKKGRPFRFLLNHSKATAPNVYLLLYPKKILSGVIDQNEKIIRDIWMKLNQIQMDTLLQEGRVYGGGLHKLEPKELSAVSAGELTNIIKTTNIGQPYQPSLF